MINSRSVQLRVAVFLLALIPLYFVFPRYRPRGSSRFTPGFLRHDNEVPMPEFVRAALSHQVSDPFDLSSISKLCQNRAPRDDVIVSCNPGTGGVGNIRSYMLHCTRFAIEAGASMLLPRFIRRAKHDLFELYGEAGDFEHFFDRRFFIDTVQAACPHMRVYENIDAEWTSGNIEIPHWPHAINVSTSQTPSPWRTEFNKWFAESTGSLQKPVIISSGDPGRDRAVMDDGRDLYYAIGRVLQFRPDARRLAALCMAELSHRFQLAIEPKHNIYQNAYMGAHLRTSSDAVKAGWNVCVGSAQ